jgi:riboflavin kinase / FMN adenylyltransferase
VEVLTDSDALPGPGAPGSVVSIGVFDGMHLGHRAILAANTSRAGELGAVSTVVTFRRHPKEVLLGRAPRTLTTLDHRLELFRRAGVGRALVLSFDETLRQTPPEDFVHRICAEGLGARAFVLGFDSKFGRDRAGTPELVRQLGYETQIVPKVVVFERAVSSTAIREAVELGDIEGAARMLGRPVSVYGEVVPGAQLGRKLGFPTANLDLHHELHPPPGVYAARVRVVEPSSVTAIRSEHEAVVNIGFRPTVTGETPTAPLVEVHLFDFDEDLYGLHLEVEFVAHIRPEQRFDGLEALSAQILKDAEAAREILAKA